MALPSLPWSPLKDAFGWIWGLYSKPRLEVRFDPQMTYHVARDLSVGGINGMFVHVIVENHGRKIATKCRGLLSEVHAENDLGAFEPAPLFRNQVELHWAHEPIDCFVKDIPPDQPTRLDVCYAHEGHPLLRFFCEHRPRGIQTDFPPGRYKIRITVRGEDGVVCSKRFLVAFDGNFRKLYMEQLEG